MKKLKLFNMDLHISVISDFKNIIKNIFPNNEIIIQDWCISTSASKIGKEEFAPLFINSLTWKELNQQMINSFQNYYHDFLSSFDGFVVTHTPVFCLLFQKFQKPIICINSCRYEQPFSWNQDINQWKNLNKQLYNMFINKQLIIVSNNLADKKYLELGTNIFSNYIPSLCEYTNMNYNYSDENKEKLAVCFGELQLFPSNNVLVSKPNNYNWKDLVNNYKAIVHVPYAISTMSIFEHISSGIPLFFPTKEFLIFLVNNNMIKDYQNLYSKNKEIYKQIGNLEEPLDEHFWIEKADYYFEELKPFLFYYSSFENCIEKLKNFQDTKENFIKRKKYLEERKQKIFEAWKFLLTPLFHG